MFTVVIFNFIVLLVLLGSKIKKSLKGEKMDKRGRKERNCIFRELLPGIKIRKRQQVNRFKRGKKGRRGRKNCIIIFNCWWVQGTYLDTILPRSDLPENQQAMPEIGQRIRQARPSTRVYSPFSQVTGTPYITPSGIP